MDRIPDLFWKNAPLFHGLNSEDRTRLAREYRWTLSSYLPGQYLATMGDPIEKLLLIARGTIAAEVIAPRGVLIMERLTQGAMLAGPVLFTADPRFPVQLRVLEETGILSLPRSEALLMLASYPGVLENFLREGGEKILFLAEKIRLVQFSSMRQKIAGHFLELARRQGGDDIRLNYTMETLADLFGVTRPALSRCLGQMVDEGSVTRLGKGHFRVSPSELEAILEAD
ncbi:transcriptional regulator [Alkalispirochaeta americana]|uniref:Transcriptional regulator n=1 Tax=Alkalispirochaeta americana TaxID=159291 RepID=A0A1N6UTI9_9SPIO|nr:Crp/Fnr family transcriptional regulator [Alkalispirochaeta americana]SIQ68851.1 transcriptional regulator [Alkalispirochaeta americana]